MDAREYLEYFIDEDTRLRIKRRQLENLQESLKKITVSMDMEQVSHSTNVTILSDTIARIVDIERDIDIQTAQIMTRKREIYMLFDKMQPKNALILMERYLDGKKVKEIKDERLISDRQVRRYLSEAIDELQHLLDTIADLAENSRSTSA